MLFSFHVRAVTGSRFSFWSFTLPVGLVDESDQASAAATGAGAGCMSLAPISMALVCSWRKVLS
jgi:hypothetical protein